MQEPPRPAIHFTARRGWINDPYGVTWHGDRYHLFYQCVPDSTDWRLDCHWGHATSADLLHWREEPIALRPGDGDDGVWSGSLVVDDAGRPTIFYTSVLAGDPGDGRVRTATAEGDDWMTWRKGDLVAAGPGPADVVMVRDPYVRRNGDGWLMLVGAGRPDATGAVLSYRSADLSDWRADGFLAGGPGNPAAPAWTGSMWECPQLVEVDGRPVLIVSVWAAGVLDGVAYAVGSSAGPAEAPSFDTAAWRRLTVGPGHYAASTFADALGRPGLLTWIRGAGDAQDAPWRGAHSVPYLLSRDGDELVARFHPAVTDAAEQVSVPGRMPGPRPGPLPGWMVQIRPGAPSLLHWSPVEGSELRLHTADGAGEGTVAVRLRARPGQLEVDLGDRAGPYQVPFAGNHVQLLVDGPVLELATDRALLATGVPILRLASTSP